VSLWEVEILIVGENSWWAKKAGVKKTLLNGA
jgi:hypothetical protein